MDSREYRRVRMRLPVRLRWTTPFGQKIELGETIDVSRGGLLVSTKEPHSAGVPLWVTFPYDSSLGDGQPEVLARVARCDSGLEAARATDVRETVQSKGASVSERSSKFDQLVHARSISDSPAIFAVAIHLEEQSRGASNGNGHRQDPERRGSPRHTLAVPVRVRPENVPWFEEAMTIDFSAKGMRFRSHREYKRGDRLKVAMNGSISTPWARTGEFRSIVVRVAPAPDNSALDVSICRIE
jgi:hypothetical protein